MNAEIKKKLFFLLLSSFVASLHFLTAWSVRACAIAVSFFIRRAQNAKRVRSTTSNYSKITDARLSMFLFSDHKNRVFRRKALTISTHRTSFSRFWRSIFLQLLVINRFIDEYAIRMYACFKHGWSLLLRIAPQPAEQRERKKRKKKKCIIFYLRDCTRRTRSRKLNPEIQSRRTRRKGYTHHFARAHDKRTTLIIIIIMYAPLYSPRAASSIPTWPMRFSRTIPCMHQLRRYLYAQLHARTLTRTHTRY